MLHLRYAPHSSSHHTFHRPGGFRPSFRKSVITADQRRGGWEGKEGKGRVGREIGKEAPNYSKASQDSPALVKGGIQYLYVSMVRYMYSY